MSRYVSIPSDRMQAGAYDADGDTFVDAAEGIRETGGPTTLTAGAVADGQAVIRSGTTYAGLARAGIDTDATTHAAKTIDTGHTGTLANLNTAITDTSISPTTWDADLSGAYDWQANGVGSQDTTSGIFAYGEVTDATTLEVGSGVITFDISASGADKEFYLVARLDAYSLADLQDASSILLSADVDMTTIDNVNDTSLHIAVTDQDWANTAITEEARIRLKRNGGNVEILNIRQLNDAVTTGAAVNWSGWANAARLLVIDNGGRQRAQAFESGSNTLTAGTTVADDGWHARAGGANRPYLVIRAIAKTGGTEGQVSGTISALSVTII